MDTVVFVLQILMWFLCPAVIGLILLQGAAGDISSSFGGGGQLDASLGVGAHRKMAQVTGFLAALFFIMVLTLAYPHRKSFHDVKATPVTPAAEMPAEKPAAAQPTETPVAPVPAEAPAVPAPVEVPVTMPVLETPKADAPVEATAAPQAAAVEVTPAAEAKPADAVQAQPEAAPAAEAPAQPAEAAPAAEAPAKP